MGPTCEVTLTQVSEALLDEVHCHLEDVADEVVQSRRGRLWEVWIEGRPIVVQVEDEPTSLGLAAGCNQPQDWQILEQLASSLAVTAGGQASKPKK